MRLEKSTAFQRGLENVRKDREDVVKLKISQKYMSELQSGSGTFCTPNKHEAGLWARSVKKWTERVRLLTKFKSETQRVVELSAESLGVLHNGGK